MKTTTKIFGFLALVALLVFSSCRKDDGYESPSDSITMAKVEGTVYNSS